MPAGAAFRVREKVCAVVVAGNDARSCLPCSPLRRFDASNRVLPRSISKPPPCAQHWCPGAFPM
eukprot:8341617-Pyramimonas_sp.AAC.2